MHRHPIPKLSEKNACPIAARKAFASILLKSGLNKKSIPAPAPGSVSEQIANIMSKRNKTGIMILDAFSIWDALSVLRVFWIFGVF